ncbi:MAG: T9SS type A sorting domain-containing protein [Calditrichia bacterium]|nr:T9SS type A sorting domain-containing protein [Calditrichia bacterium]
MKKMIMGIITVVLTGIMFLPLLAENQGKITTVHELELALGNDFSVNKGEINLNIENIPYVENINVTNNSLPQNETAMAINPLNTKNLVVSMNDFRMGLSGQSIACSQDGGATWQTQTIASPENNVYYIDPSAAFDNQGNVYVAYLAVNQGAHLTGTGIVVLKSEDGGSTWGEPIYVANDLEGGTATHSRPFLTIDKNSNKVFVAWVLTEGAKAFPVISHSTNNVAQFSERIKIAENCNAVRNAVPALASNGDVYVTYFDLMSSKTHITKSVNNAASFSEVHAFTVNQIGEAIGYRRILKGALKTNSYPSLAIDNSNTSSKGNIYLTWADNMSGNPDVYMIASSDNGANWSNAIKINNDNSSADQFFPAITVDDITGAINVAFYDSRNDENNQLVDTYLAQSFDGGETFINTKITTAPSNPEVGFDNRGEKFFGDYLAVVSHNNVVFSAYTDSREGNQEVFVAKFDKTETQELEIAEGYALAQNYPNPFNPETVISFSLKHEAPVSLVIYNALGQKVSTLINNKVMGAENHTIHFNAAKLTGGIYFYRLTAGSYVSTRKMVYLK